MNKTADFTQTAFSQQIPAEDLWDVVQREIVISWQICSSRVTQSRQCGANICFQQLFDSEGKTQHSQVEPNKVSGVHLNAQIALMKRRTCCKDPRVPEQRYSNMRLPHKNNTRAAVPQFGIFLFPYKLLICEFSNFSENLRFLPF